jgi:AcrR family transcriptional regulator
MSKLYPGYRDEIRKKIVAEAFSIFLAKGFEGTKMEDIAARLNVTKPAIYRYFKNKEELFFVALVEHLMNEYKEVFTSSFASDDLLLDGSAFFDGLLEINRKYATISTDIIMVISRNESLRSGVRECQLDGLRIIQQFFLEQIEKGRIHPDLDAKDIAWAFHTLIKGSIENVMIGMDSSEAKRVWLTVFAELLKIQK